MTNHKNLSTRVKKAKSTTATIVSDGLVKVQGSKTYTVKVSRADETMTLSCQCQGNKATICYHGMVAVVRLAEAKGYKVAFCVSKEHAQLLSRIGGKVYRIKSHNGTGELFMVAQKVTVMSDWREAHLEQLGQATKSAEEWLENNSWSVIGQQNLTRLAASRDALRVELGM